MRVWHRAPVRSLGVLYVISIVILIALRRLYGDSEVWLRSDPCVAGRILQRLSTLCILLLTVNDRYRRPSGWVVWAAQWSSTSNAPSTWCRLCYAKGKNEGSSCISYKFAPLGSSGCPADSFPGIGIMGRYIIYCVFALCILNLFNCLSHHHHQFTSTK